MKKSFSQYVENQDNAYQRFGATNYPPDVAANVKTHYGDPAKMRETISVIDRSLNDIVRRLGELKVMHPGLLSEKAALALKDAWSQDFRKLYTPENDD